MHTTIDKHKPKPWEHIIDENGLAWSAEMPNCDRDILKQKKYRACIPDARIDHCSFESFGWHLAWADTIEELVLDIKSFDVPYYSEDVFLKRLMDSDSKDLRTDRQVELYFDSRGTKVTRGELTLNNMTAYTSF